MGTSAVIEAGTAVERVQAYPMLQAACENAQRARDAASNANIALAFHYWDKVFGGRFPAYY